MAIYQFYLTVIPKQSVLEKFDSVPETIPPNTETGYFESNTEIFWNTAQVTATEIVKRIDTIVKRAEWGNSDYSFNWKTYSLQVDNDAYLSLNKETLYIESLSFRADLREPNLKFLEDMISLGKEYNWLFIDRKGTIAKPYFEEIKTLIKTSNAYRFLKDPDQFFDDLDSGTIKLG